MDLPEELEDRFELQYVEMERSRTIAQSMPPIIKRAQDRGERIAKREVLLKYLSRHFGNVPSDLHGQIEDVDELAVLDRLIDAAMAARTLEEFQTAMPR
jgi:hypothetical protein